MPSCVVPANNDLANQEIIDLALEHADQSRVLGVFTKCDTIKDSEVSISLLATSHRLTTEI
jgi:hypothetical protein